MPKVYDMPQKAYMQKINISNQQQIRMLMQRSRPAYLIRPNASLNAYKPDSCPPMIVIYSITTVFHKLIEQQINLLLHAQHI